MSTRKESEGTKLRYPVTSFFIHFYILDSYRQEIYIFALFTPIFYIFLTFSTLSLLYIPKTEFFHDVFALPTGLGCRHVSTHVFILSKNSLYISIFSFRRMNSVSNLDGLLWCVASFKCCFNLFNFRRNILGDKTNLVNLGWLR